MSLNLNGNSLSLSSVIALLNALQTNMSLQRLSLIGQNDEEMMDDRTLEKALCQLLVSNKAFQSLAIDLRETGDPE